MRRSKRLRRVLKSLMLKFLSFLGLLAIFVLLLAITYIALASFDDSTRKNVIEGIASNLVTAALVTILGITAFVYFSIIERRYLFRFFGINNIAPALRVYLSRLQVKAGGTEGTEEIQSGYVGPTIVQSEYEAGLLILELFRPSVFVIIPDVLRALLGSLFLTMSTIRVRLGVSPRTISEVTESELSDNIITVGGSVYNSVSLLCLAEKRSFYYFSKNHDGERVIMIRRSSGPDTEVPVGPNQGLAFIERMKDPDRGITVFVCAGLGSAATRGSVEYLVQNWRRLRRRYENTDFGFCLAFDNQPHDAYFAVEPTVIHETSRGANADVLNRPR